MTSRQAELEATHPGAYFLDAQDEAGLASYLRDRGWIDATTRIVRVAPAGAGNMNLTLRVSTSAGSLIVKQARPWVERYPQFAAPSERALVEGRFYERVASRPRLAATMPRLLGTDPRSHILALEDLGDAADFSYLYQGGTLAEIVVDDLAHYLAELHIPYPEGPTQDLANRAMRILNHAHMFEIPLNEANGVDLDAFSPGLRLLARSVQQDARYRARVTALGRRYLEDGPSLLHGDFFPGSWLSTTAGTRVIDPEFCFFGPPELDLGVMVAHLHLAQQDPALVTRLFDRYGNHDRMLVEQFAGVEIMRRLIGVAQLPFALTLEQKANLLDRSRALVLS